MARVVPILDEQSLKRLGSPAEAEVYRRCKELPNEYLVLFSFPWIDLTPTGIRRDGETDFIVFHPQKGILFVEVKGGGISMDPTHNCWTSRNRKGQENSIKNPFRQAHDCKYAFLNHLKEDEEWSHLGMRPLMGHAVLLPDITDASPNAVKSFGP